MEFQKQVLFVVPHSMSMKAWKNIYVFWTFFLSETTTLFFSKGSKTLCEVVNYNFNLFRNIGSREI